MRKCKHIQYFINVYLSMLLQLFQDYNPLLMVEEVSSPMMEDNDVTRGAGSSHGLRPRADSPIPDDTSEHSSTQLSDVRFTFNRQFHMGSSHQYRLWKDVFGQHRHDTVPRRHHSEGDSGSQYEDVNGGPDMDTRRDNSQCMATGGGIHNEDTSLTNQSIDRHCEDSCSPLSAVEICEGVFRGALSLPEIPQSVHDSEEDFIQPSMLIINDHRRSFERNWTNLMEVNRDDVFAVCTNPNLSYSNENTLSSRGSLGHSAGRPTRSSSLNDLDTLLDNFSLGTGSARNSLGRHCGEAITTSRDTFGQLFAVSNRLAGLSRPRQTLLEPTVEETIREPVHLTNLFIDPNQPQTVDQDSSGNDGASSSSYSNTNSMQSNNSGRRNVQQNWYVYDPRLLPGGAGREDATRLTVETNYRGVQQSWSMPGIINPPSYEEVTSSPITGLPPPYPDSVSTLSSIGPPSESDGAPPEPVDPPPPYEPPSPPLGDYTNCLDIDTIEAPLTGSLDLRGGHHQQEHIEADADTDPEQEDEFETGIGSDCAESEDAIDEELDSILEEEASNDNGSIGNIAENNHGFFMNADTGNARISAFGGAIMSGIGFGAARPPVRWNRGMGLDRWASTSNWVSS